MALIAATGLSVRLVALAPGWRPRLVRVDQVVELGALAVGVCAAWWLAVTLGAAVACLLARALGRTWAGGERFVARHAPAVVRRGLALSVGAGLGLLVAVGPAGAGEADPPADLGWVATQVAETPAASPAAGPSGTGPSAAPVAAPGAGPGPVRVTVQPGDSLWTIAAGQLASGASAAQIAAAWPHWYEANRTVVGDDPDRIRPGQVLTAPPDAAVPAEAPAPTPAPPGAWR